MVGRGGVTGEDLVPYCGPLKRVADAFGDVVLRLPAKQARRAVDPGVGASNVTRPAFGIARLDRALDDVVERVKKFPDGGAPAGPQVDGGRWPGQGIEPVQRGHVRRGQVPDVDVVPEA